jgi:hypothetical protein
MSEGVAFYEKTNSSEAAVIKTMFKEINLTQCTSERFGNMTE